MAFKIKFPSEQVLNEGSHAPQSPFIRIAHCSLLCKGHAVVRTPRPPWFEQGSLHTQAGSHRLLHSQHLGREMPGNLSSWRRKWRKPLKGKNETHRRKGNCSEGNVGPGKTGEPVFTASSVLLLGFQAVSITGVERGTALLMVQALKFCLEATCGHISGQSKSSGLP